MAYQWIIFLSRHDRQKGGKLHDHNNNDSDRYYYFSSTVFDFFSVYKYGKEIKQNEERDNKNPPWN